jgi:hypothetical protein
MSFHLKWNALLSRYPPPSMFRAAPGWSVSVRGPVGQQDGSTMVEDNYWPVVGWVVTFPADTGDEIEPVFCDPTVPDTMSLSAWKKAFASPGERAIRAFVPADSVPQ